MAGAPGSGMSLDARNLDALKKDARDNPQAAIKRAARQVEAQFTQMLLSQMRQSSLAGEGGIASIFNSPAAKSWQGMMDQQLSQVLAGVPNAQPKGTPVAGEVDSEALKMAAMTRQAPTQHGLGLADMIEKQLSKQNVSPAALRESLGSDLSMSTLALADATKPVQGIAYDPRARQVMGSAGFQAAGYSPAGGFNPGMGGFAPRRVIQNGKFEAPVVERGNSAIDQDLPADQMREAFVKKFYPAAKRAEAATGIPAEFMVGQAALESGWGRREIRGDDGKPTHNLFGIKATGWNGKVSVNTTTEYTNGKAERVQEAFRAYDSYDHAFEDYARLLAKNPRYAGVVQANTPEQFGFGMQKAGYATDPKYGEKLTGTIKATKKLVM
jgi:flagellar protein FlgJ